MIHALEEKLKLAVELQKKLKKKVFCADDEQWQDEKALLCDDEYHSNVIAGLIAEVQSSAAEFRESAFYLAAKQLFDCRRMLECKREQKLGPCDDWKNSKDFILPQEVWPESPYIIRDRAEKRAFEELYPVEHLSTLFRFGIDLMSDCEPSQFLGKEEAELVRNAINYQLIRTKASLEESGYSFVNPVPYNKRLWLPERTIMLCECSMCGQTTCSEL